MLSFSSLQNEGAANQRRHIVSQRRSHYKQDIIFKFPTGYEVVSRSFNNTFLVLIYSFRCFMIVIVTSRLNKLCYCYSKFQGYLIKITSEIVRLPCHRQTLYITVNQTYYTEIDKSAQLVIHSFHCFKQIWNAWTRPPWNISETRDMC